MTIRPLPTKKQVPLQFDVSGTLNLGLFYGGRDILA